MYAAQGGHVHVVELLVAHEGDVLTKNNRGVTALMWAAERGWKEVCELLLSYNRHNRLQLTKEQATISNYINFQNESGKTALMLAAERGCKDVVKASLEVVYELGYRCDLSIHDIQSCTAYYWAILKGHNDIAEMFITYGYDLDTRDDDHRTLFIRCCYRGELSPPYNEDSSQCP